MSYKYKSIKVFVLFLILFSIMILLTSCKKESKESKPEQQSAEGGQSEKPPEQLKKLEESIEKLFKELNGPALAIKEDKQSESGDKSDKKQEGSKSDESKSDSSKTQDKESDKSGGKENDKSGSKESGDKESGGKDSSSKQDSSKSEKKASTPEPKDPFEKVNKAIDELHFQWNAYTPLSQKAGANKMLIDNFSNSLNTLTTVSKGKDKLNTMIALNILYSYVPDFFYLYKSKNSPEIKKVRHYIRSTMLNSMKNNYPIADIEIGNLRASWNVYRNTIPKNLQDMGTKLDFAIMELEKVEKEKSTPLVEIKGKVAFMDAESLEKYMEEANK